MVDRSIVVRGLEDLADWVIACLFVSGRHRRAGLGTELIRAAVGFSGGFDAVQIEGYPVDTGGRETPDLFAFTGTARQYAAAGFEEVARQRPTRPIMRRLVQ